MIKQQPKGLYVLALANTGERFGYYTMISILVLYVQAKFALSTSIAGVIYSTFLALVYFLPMVGGFIADRWSFSKSVSLGIIVMFAGYLTMAIPIHTDTGTASASFFVMIAALLLIAIGTGLFKGNLQVMIGDLYNDLRYASQRDMGYSIFYMAINIGAMFAPSVSQGLCSLALEADGMVYNPLLPGLCNAFIAGETLDAESLATLVSLAGNPADLLGWCKTYMNAISSGYSLAFGVACLSMVLSYIIYKAGAKTYAGVSDKKAGNTLGATSGAVPELTPQQTRSRIVALLMVFAVVIFFWMVFNQNGLTMTKFAEMFTRPEGGGATRIGFNVWALAVLVVVVYSLFFAITTKGRARSVSIATFVVSAVGVALFYVFTPDPVTGLQPQIYQQFGPFFVVALTPFSMALFTWLGNRGKEPTAPRKIGYGMIVAAVGFGVLALGSIGLGVPSEDVVSPSLVSPNWLISTYLVLTFAELLLSPMGISFVSKVAPPRYKGAMMGCWFASTAVGSLLSTIPALLWDKIDVALLWVILLGLCLLSAGFIFAIMKRLEAATR